MKKLVPAVLAAIALFALPACSASKPSVDKIHDRLVVELKKAGGTQLTDTMATKLADCMAPKLYDQLSADSLNQLVEKGQDAVGTEADKSKATSIGTQCASVLVTSG